MSNDIALLKGTFEMGTDLATMLGFKTGGEQTSTLAELKQLYKAVKGEMEHKGKKMAVEVIPGGSYSLTLQDGSVVYSDTATVRIFMQRYQYQRYEKFAAPVDGRDGKMYYSVLSTGFNTGDLKDNYGGFNCGRPGGYIKDYDSLTGTLRDIVKNTKRVMIIFGYVTLDNPTDEAGNPVDNPGTTPFFMRIKNASSYKNVDSLAKVLMKQNRLPIQYNVTFTNDSIPLPNGELNFFVVAEPKAPVELTAEDQQAVKDFITWIEVQNGFTLKQWSAANDIDISDEDKEVLQKYIQIEDSSVEEQEDI